MTVKMEWLPEEIREIIFDDVLQHTPLTLFSLRCVSRQWKSFVDEYIGRFSHGWFGRCQKEIPKRCFTDLVKEIAPRSAYPWQDEYWMRSARTSTIPQEVYKAWNNLPSLMLDTVQISTFYSSNLPEAEEVIDDLIVKDKFIVESKKQGPGRREEVSRTRFFELPHLQETSSAYREVSFHLRKADFLTSEGTLLILVQLEDDNNLYVVDSPGDERRGVPGGLSFSGLHLDVNEKWLIIANECFAINGAVITHYKFHGGLFHVNDQITLPSEPPPIAICNIHINGTELQVLVLMTQDADNSEFRMYRYKISGESSNKTLSFTAADNEFFEVINCNSLGLSESRAGEAVCFITANMMFIKSASLNSVLLTNFGELCDVSSDIPLRETFENVNNRSLWSTGMEDITHVTYLSNYLVLCTSTGLLVIYKLENIDQIVESVELNATSPEHTVIVLNSEDELVGVHIFCVDSKYRIIAEGQECLYIIDFPGIN